MAWQENIPPILHELYEIYDFHHASAILAVEFPDLFQEICSALGEFRISTEDILAPGKNESKIPKILSSKLRPLGWKERKMKAEVVVDGTTMSHDTHKVDYIKGRVAFDLEWNSKDQTFDRDLYAFRAFFEYDKVSVGILVTRSLELNDVFRELGVMHKYGASTTHIPKLIPRLTANRNGGCPVLVFGITKKVITREEGNLS